MEAEKIEEFAGSLTSFFALFDGLFLYDENIEKMLEETKKSLEEKILHNESLLPVIMAMGGNYDSDIDRAKVKEIEALQQLLKARKNLQKATEKEKTKKRDCANLMALFGL